MHSRIVVTALTLILSVALAPNPTTGQTRDAPTSPRTPWGHPNLQGIWTNVSVTPLERPREFAGRTQLTDEEIAALEGEVGGLRSFRQQTEEARDAGDPLDEQRLDRQGLNYNSFWYQQKTVSRQTSLIVDPPDGQRGDWKRTSVWGSRRSVGGDTTTMTTAVCGNVVSLGRSPGSLVPTTTTSSYSKPPLTWSCSWR